MSARHMSAQIAAQTARTPGPWSWEALPAADDGAIVIVYTLHGTHRATTYDPLTAKLIVDAGNTLSSTGCTPSHLADQRDDLVKTLQVILPYLQCGEKIIARAALAKAGAL